MRVSAAVMGIEFSYAAETAFVSPTLLKIGVDHQHMTLVWALSPLVGFFVTPILGSMSDRCRLKYGRRRPFILLLALGVFIGKPRTSSYFLILFHWRFCIFFKLLTTFTVPNYKQIFQTFLWCIFGRIKLLHLCRTHFGTEWRAHWLRLRRRVVQHERDDPARTPHNGEATRGGHAGIRWKDFLALLGHLLHHSRHGIARLRRRRLSESGKGVSPRCHYTW